MARAQSQGPEPGLNTRLGSVLAQDKRGNNIGLRPRTGVGAVDIHKHKILTIEVTTLLQVKVTLTALDMIFGCFVDEAL